MRLDAVCEIVMGQAPDGAAYNTEGKGWPLIAGAGDFEDGLPAPSKFTTEAPKLSRPGDIILGIRASIGEKVTGDGVYCLGRGVAAIRSKGQLDCRFLWHWLTHITPVLAAKGKGATFKQVNKEDIGELPIDPPPLPEQRRIAAILDQAEALRAKRRAALAKLDTLAQSIFIEMFGDPEANPNRWPFKRLSELTRSDDGINYGVIQPGDDVEDGVPLIRVGDLVDGSVAQTSLKRIASSIEAAYKRSRLRGDEILVSCVGSIGVVALADESVKGFNIARAVARIPLGSDVRREFIAEALKTQAIQRYFTSELRTVSQPTLNIKQLSETLVPIPPEALQKSFEKKIESLRALKKASQASLLNLDVLFTSLQHRAFHGEL
jgi:type I restriction enzyme S subunit